MRIVLLALALLLPSSADARDLRERIGVGYSNQFSGSESGGSLSVRYHLPTRSSTIRMSVEATAGFSLYSNPKVSDAWFGGARLLYGLVAEDNMTLYTAVGGAVASLDGTNTIFRFQPAMGAQFFLYGLENLGFSTEWGGNVDLGDPSSSLSSVSGGPAVAVHYYF